MEEKKEELKEEKENTEKLEEVIEKEDTNKNEKKVTDKKDSSTKAEDLKKEATEAVSQVKDTIKKVDIKKDSVETKGFIVEMFKDPLGKIQQIANKNTGKYLTYSIIILVVWVLAQLIQKVFSYSHIWKYSNIGSAIISTIIYGITPIISVIVLSLIVFFINKKNKKHLTTITTIIITASIPLVLASVVQLLTIINVKVSLVTEPFTQLCNVISIVLMYFFSFSVFLSFT